MNAKSLFASKTFWFNAASIAGLLIQYASGLNWVSSGDAATLIATVNIGLRIITSQPVTIPGVSPK